MKRLLALAVLAVGFGTGCAPIAHVEICPPYCGPANGHHGRPAPPPDLCVGYGTDDDLHLVPCAP